MKKLKYDDIKNSLPSLFNNSDALIRIIINDDEISKWQEQKRESLLKHGIPDWADIGVILDDPYVIAIRDLVEFSSGFRNGYLRFLNRAYVEGGAAGVVLLPEKDGKILLLHNFRHPTRSWHWEIPRGFGEPGITAQDQARKEIKEEIGGEISEIIDLGIIFSNTGLEGNPINLFLVRLSTIGEPDKEIGIDQLSWFSVTELEKMIISGEITDGFTIAAYTRAKLKGLI